LSRRPILSIEPLRHIVNDSLLIIKGIVVLNLGNIEADIKSILFFVPKINFVKIAPSNAVLITEDKELYSYEFSTMVNNFNPLIITDKSKMQIKEIEFYYRLTSLPLDQYPMIKYNISYVSKYSSAPFLGIFNYKNNLIK